MIGDVCGHGPDEAALGVCLRIAWRALVLAGHPEQEILPMLQRLLIHERHRPMLFTTVCMVWISPDRGRAKIWSAGHPLPLLRDGDGMWEVPTVPLGLPLGLDLDCAWSPAHLELSPCWELLLFTDGLIEGRSGPHGQRLWVEGLLAVLRELREHCGQDPQRLVDGLVAKVRELDPGHADDVAVVLLAYPSRTVVSDDA